MSTIAVTKTQDPREAALTRLDQAQDDCIEAVPNLGTIRPGASDLEGTFLAIIDEFCYDGFEKNMAKLAVRLWLQCASLVGRRPGRFPGDRELQLWAKGYALQANWIAGLCLRVDQPEPEPDNAMPPEVVLQEKPIKIVAIDNETAVMLIPRFDKKLDRTVIHEVLIDRALFPTLLGGVRWTVTPGGSVTRASYYGRLRIEEAMHLVSSLQPVYAVNGNRFDKRRSNITIQRPRKT